MSEKHLANRTYTRKKIENFSYGLNDTIGKGYSSQVFRGRNDDSDQPVAVKVIDLKMLKCEINKTLLSSQIEILKSLRNFSNILHLHEVYTTKNNTYIITQLCDGDLSRKIKKKLTESEVFNYMTQFINGYSHIYDKKIIHRDLKPANLLLTPDNELKIADFGFGIKAQEVQKPSKYNVGSPLYMAPQSLKRNQYSFKTDIWAIGIIFYEMLTCDTPWRAKNQKQLLRKIQNQKIDSIVNKKDFSPIAKQFLIRSLSQDKNTRLNPEDLIRFNFKNSDGGSILSEKKLNTTVKAGKFMSIFDKTVSPKNLFSNRSIEKKLFRNQCSDKKIVKLNTVNNYSINETQNTSGKGLMSPSVYVELSKDERKHVSKLLIAEVHFCRFLYKLLGRLKESIQSGLLGTSNCSEIVSDVFQLFTGIIKHKIINLKNFQNHNFLKIARYSDYKMTSDFKKLIKISKDYFERYSSELKIYWDKVDSFSITTDDVDSLIKRMMDSLEMEIVKMNKPEQQIQTMSKDIIILDYLITCRQLLDMIKDGENYEKFTKKSRIEEIVEGITGQINFELYLKIVDRANCMYGRE